MRFQMLFMSVLLLFCVSGITSNARAEELLLFAGAGLRKPMDQIITEFEKNTDDRVIVSYDGAGRLAARYLATKQGDLFMPGAYFYIENLRKKGWVVSDESVVYHIPVVAVHRRGRHHIETFEDLKNPGLRLALGDPEAMAFGRTAMGILERSGIKDEVLGNVVVYGATVNQLTLYVVKRAVDASIIGRSNAFLHRDVLRMIEIPVDYFEPEIIAIAVLKSSRKRELAARFQHFVASSEGIEYFEESGFVPVEK